MQRSTQRHRVHDERTLAGMDQHTNSGKPVGIGIIGAGVISRIYLENLTRRFANTRVVAIADIVPAAASARAREFGIRAFIVDELLADPEVEIVLNLTIPAAHAEVAIAAVRAGKPVYNEKPITGTRDDGRMLLHLATDRKLRVGGAPGAGLQTVRKLIHDGAIGEPVAASGAMLSSGHESWHANPAFYYQPGAGPMLDMGPYYVTALVTLLGPIRRVSSSTRASFPTRTITSEPRKGETITVNTPSHIAAILDFESGPIATLTTSFDTYDTDHSLLTIYGSKGSIRVPDPNNFGGPVKLLKAGSEQWEEIPLIDGYAENSRGLGVADMARAIRNGGEHRASGELAYHVLDVMLATLESSERGQHVMIESTAERPAPMATRLA